MEETSKEKGRKGNEENKWLTQTEAGRKDGMKEINKQASEIIKEGRDK